MSRELDELTAILSSIQTRLENKPDKDKREMELLNYVKEKRVKAESLRILGCPIYLDKIHCQNCYFAGTDGGCKYKEITGVES